jgi:probable rRNA maturation factor
MTHSEEESIQFYSEDITFELESPGEVITWLEQMIKAENRKLVHLNFIFCSDEYLHQINVQHLQHDTYTDIITFPYQTEAIEGDLFISIERLRENAKTYQTSFVEELYRVMAHGVLHLIGFNDKTPEEKLKMTARENHYLSLAFPARS